MGTRDPVNAGPLRTSYGLADVHFDGTVLRLVVYRGPVEVLDRYRWVVGAVGLVVAAAAVYADWWLLVLAALLLLVAAVVPRRTGTAIEVAESDIDTMDHVYGAVRVHLVLHPDPSVGGDVTLSGWFWRRRQLDHLQRRLGE